MHTYLSLPYLKEKWTHAGFQKYLKNTGWMFVAQFFSLAAAFFISAWLARYLGPHNYGIFNYALAFAGLFSFIISLGVDGILSKELVDKPEKINQLLGTGLGIKIFGATIAFIAISISSFIFIDDILTQKLIIAYSLVFIFEPFTIVTLFFQSQVQAKINSQIKIFALLISSLLKIFLILTAQGILLLVLILVFEAFLIAFLSVYFYIKKGFSLTHWQFDPALARKIISLSVFLMLASGANYIFMKIDQVMIGTLLDTVAVGFYSVAVKLVEVWYFVPVILTSSLFPAIINAKNTNITVYHRRLKFFFLLLFGVGVLLSIFSFIAAPLFIEILFGAQYTTSIAITQIYAWSGIGLFVGWGIYHYLLSQNKIYTIFYFYFFSMLVNVILTYYFILTIGLTGAAWATVISYTIGPVIFGVLHYKKIVQAFKQYA